VARLSALVVTEPVLPTNDLDSALVDGGFDVRHASPADIAAQPGFPSGLDVVFVSAELGLQRVALLSQRLTGVALLVFPQGDLASLEACARGGFDYVAPPFLPGLVRARVSSLRDRRDMVTAVEQMAAEASLRAYERDLDVARDIQAGFLPDHLPAPPGWEVEFRFRPAKHVAGDFYDGFDLVNGQRLGFVVADVCDKGISAALFMALIRTLVRHTAEHAGAWSPLDESSGIGPQAGALSQILSIGAGPLVQSVVGTNRYLARNHWGQGYFVTLFFGVLDPVSGSLLFINGGHNPPVLLGNDGHALLQPTGPAVGMSADSTFCLGYATMSVGDTLFLYTDGVVEARADSGDRFGMDRLTTVLSERHGTANALLSAVDQALGTHIGAAEQSDDITMMALRRVV
jgi:sigma-B regulation protein RsbU (phosphoserine phosphatase)